MKQTLMTVRLWRALQTTSNRLPLYGLANYSFRQSRDVTEHFETLSLYLVTLTLIIVVPAMTVGLVKLVPDEIDFSLPLLFFAGPAISLVIILHVFGILWLIRSSGTVNHLRRTGIYDLLALQPRGVLAVQWLICFRTLHIHSALDTMTGFSSAVIVYGVFGVGVELILLIINQFDASATTMQPQSLLVFVVSIAAFYFQFIQLIVTQLLIGILMSLYASEFEARLGAVAFFLFSQAIIYLITASTVIGFIFIMSDVERDLLMPADIALLALLIFVAMSEIVIRRLWKLLLRRLNADASELDGLLYRRAER